MVRPLCPPCFDEFEICAAVEMTRQVSGLIHEHAELLGLLRDRKDVASEIWGRRKADGDLPPDVSYEASAIFGEDVLTAPVARLRCLLRDETDRVNTMGRRAAVEISRALIDSGFDFGAAFERVRSGELSRNESRTDGLPRYSTCIPGISAEDVLSVNDPVIGRFVRRRRRRRSSA
jgi:hypothetical protein